MPFLTNDPLPQCLQQSSAMGASTLGGHERDVSAISLEVSVSLVGSRRSSQAAIPADLVPWLRGRLFSTCFVKLLRHSSASLISERNSGERPGSSLFRTANNSRSISSSLAAFAWS